MNKYILVSTKFEGYLVYGYNKKGYLVHFENCTWEMSDEQLLYACNNIGFALGQGNFLEWINNCGFKVLKAEVDLSFERFWMVYDNARNKKEAEALWRKMNDEARIYAFHVHAAYDEYCKKYITWYTKMYPDTFLRSHLHDEFYKIKAPEKK